MSFVMKKIVVERPGGYSVLKVASAPDPAPEAGQVLVASEAMGVNYADCVVRMGLYASAKEFVGWPITPGFEFAGRIVGLGTGVTTFELGQRVMGATRFGGYATRHAVAASQLFPVPESWTLSEAATFPTAFFTAWYALCELQRVRPGARVLVHSAAGGVGGALTQIARALGCHVVGVVGGAHKVALVKELGADVVIDKSSTELWRAVEQASPSGYDIVLDANGASTLRGSYAHLRASGRLISYGAHSMLVRGRGTPNWFKLALDYLRTPRFNPLEMTNANKSVLAFNLSYFFERLELIADASACLLDWQRAGKIKPLPVTEFAFDDVAAAHRALETGNTLGKLCLRAD